MDNNLLQDFINESREHLADIESDLLQVEERGADIDEVIINKVFRAAHSIKGGSGFFGFDRIKELAHKAETVLDMLRSRKMVPNAEVINILLAAFDKLREMINRTEASKNADIAELLVSLTGMASSYLPVDEKASLHTDVTLKGPGTGRITLHQTDFDRAGRNCQYIYWLDCDLVNDIEMKGQNILSLFNTLTEMGEIFDCTVDYEAVGTLDGPVGRVPLRLVVATIFKPEDFGMLFDTIEQERIHLLFDPYTDPSKAVPAETPIKSPTPIAEMFPPAADIPIPDVSPIPDRQPETLHETTSEASLQALAAAPFQSTNASPSSAPVVEETLRVNVSLLETLMNLAGELVLSRNQLRAAVVQENRQMLTFVDQRINQVTSELQDVIMQTRLQPIGNVFSKFPRIVRDLSRTLGKEIHLDILGKDVAMDKTLIEGLSDPLTHMVHNSVDHGIETTEERLRIGKKPVGTVRIEARHEAGQVVVEISDDGKGIDPQRVADSAVRKGLITAEKAQVLSDADKQSLIFLPGLSTAGQVSEISGRGVGMDVVKTNLDRLGGQVEIVSEVAKGSTFRIKLPLTLAIIPSLIVSVEDERFVIPQANIEELLRLHPEEVKNRIEIIGDSEVLLLRDRTLPLTRFADILGTMTTYINPETGRREINRRTHLADRRSRRHGQTSRKASDTDSSNPNKSRHARTCCRRLSAASVIEIAVITTGTLSYGLVVGAFHDTEEVVVKPLGRRFKHLSEYSGATILGDGAVALILDIPGLAVKAGLTSVAGSARAAELAAEAEVQRLKEVHSLLLFQNGPDEPCAVSLDLIQRIERVSPNQVERLGDQRTMQYRGNSLPLVTLSDAAAVGSIDAEKDLVVLVSNARGREVGLLGTMPVDVIETRATIDQSTHRQKGIAGSAILNDRTTLITDLYELVDTVHPDWNAVRADFRTTVSLSGETTTVLLAEDSDFFRAQVKKYLEDDGFKVLAAPDGEAAWELLCKNIETVRVVVTDIEMPRLTGLELAARIRNDARTAGLPIIAVTALAGEDDAARGIAAGVTEYHVKLDRDSLLASIHGMIHAHIDI